MTEKDTNIKRLVEWASTQGMVLSDRQQEQFAAYKAHVLVWNEKINLTAITAEPDFTIKHFIDSLTVLPWIPDDARLVDVGTGAGFPGLPVKIARPGVSLTLLDSLRKRILFLRHTVALLGLNDVECIHARAEERRQAQNDYDICTARAVARLDKLAGYTLPLLKPGGLLLAMKGTQMADELKQAAPALRKYGGECVAVKPVTIAPGLTHAIVVIQKSPR